MKAVFICDNKEEWEFYTNVFKLHFNKIELICKISVKDAIQFISEDGAPLFVIMDALIKGDTLEKYFHEICMMTEKRPVVFIAAPDNIPRKLPIDFYEVNSANGVIKRPFLLDQFKDVIKKILKAIHGELLKLSSIEMNKDDCLPMKVRNFYRFKKVPYDVYLELSATKFVKIINKNEAYTEGMIQRYISKKVRFFYLEKKDHLQFLERSLLSLLKILHTPKIAKESILAAQISSVAIIHEYIRTIGVCDKIILLTKKLIEKTFRVYRDVRTLPELIKIFPFRDHDLSEQAVLTMYICEAILIDMGWGNDIMRSKLGLASIIHDCLLSNDDLVSISSAKDPNLKMFSSDEQEEYLSHPKRTAEVALGFQGFPESEFIILQHHELPSGQGFPQSINSHQITALSCVFIVANNFVCELSQKGVSKTSLVRILTTFTETYDTGNFKKPLASLRKFFKV